MRVREDLDRLERLALLAFLQLLEEPLSALLGASIEAASTRAAVTEQLIELARGATLRDRFLAAASAALGLARLPRSRHAYSSGRNAV